MADSERHRLEHSVSWLERMTYGLFVLGLALLAGTLVLLARIDLALSYSVRPLH